MKLSIVMAFLFIQNILAYQEGTRQEQTKHVNNSTLNASCICEEKRLENIEENLKLLLDDNSRLRLKLDTLTTITSSIYIHLTKFETTTTNTTSTISILTTATRQNESTNSIEHTEAPWTIIQRRQDGSVDFNRNWAEYQNGFGNLDGEFFIGLDILHALTQSTPHELWIKMEDFQNHSASANYSRFSIGDSSEAYALKILGSFNGEAGDSLRYHVDQKFSTKDVDNDMKFNSNCAAKFTGAWWYNDCYHNNLNGQYLGDKNDQKGITWYYWHNNFKSLKYVHMAIRPVHKNK